jgi:Lrp/AsnC family leucine-responsive transcriptional regulator
MTRAATALDRIDFKLLRELQADAGRTLQALGDRVGLSASAVQRRMRRYRDEGILERTVAVLNPQRLPGGVAAVVLVTLEHGLRVRNAAFRALLNRNPDVLVCFALTGTWDYLLVVAGGSLAETTRTIEQIVSASANVKRYDTLFVTDSTKLAVAWPARLGEK